MFAIVNLLYTDKTDHFTLNTLMTHTYHDTVDVQISISPENINGFSRMLAYDLQTQFGVYNICSGLSKRFTVKSFCKFSSSSLYLSLLHFYRLSRFDQELNSKIHHKNLSGSVL